TRTGEKVEVRAPVTIEQLHAFRAREHGRKRAAIGSNLGLEAFNDFHWCLLAAEARCGPAPRRGEARQTRPSQTGVESRTARRGDERRRQTCAATPRCRGSRSP